MSTSVAERNAMVAGAVIALAAEALDGSSSGMKSSARVALDDANTLRSRGDFCSAADRALTSIAYSEGLFSKRARAAKRWMEV